MARHAPTPPFRPLRLLALLACALAALASAPALAAAAPRSGTIQDPNDGGVDLEGDPAPDLRALTVTFDPETGTLGATAGLHEQLPEDYDVTLTFRVGRVGADNACGGDMLSVRGSFYSYTGFGGFPGDPGQPPPTTTQHSSSIEGLGIASTDGTANASGDTLTLSAAAEGLKGQELVCVDEVVLDARDDNPNGPSIILHDEGETFFFDGFAPVGVRALGAPAVERTAYAPGETVAASAELVSAGPDVTLTRAAIVARAPGEGDAAPPVWELAPALDGRVVHDGERVALGGTLALPADAPTGEWRVLAAWRDDAGAWHYGPARTITVSAPPAPAPRPPAGDVAGVQRRGGPLVRLFVLTRSLALARQKRSVRIAVDCDSACSVTLRMRSRGRLIATGSARLRGAGKLALRLPLTRSGRKLLAKRPRKLLVTLRATMLDAEGQRSATARTLTTTSP